MELTQPPNNATDWLTDWLTHLQFAHFVLADDVLEVDDVLVLEPRQHLHLSERPLAERLMMGEFEKERIRIIVVIHKT